MQSDDPLSRVVALVPSYRGGTPQFEVQWERLCEQGVSRRRLWGSPVNLARNTLTAEFLNLDAQPWALWLDDDIGFTLQILRSLVNEAERLGVDIFGAAYPKRDWNKGLIWQPADESADVVWGEGGEPRRARWLGGGCLLTSRRALQNITDRAPSRWLDYPRGSGPPLKGKAIWRSTDLQFGNLWIESGEDQGFCALAESLDWHIWCDTRVRLWHYGGHGYDVADAFLGLERPRTVEQPGRMTAAQLRSIAER